MGYGMKPYVYLNEGTIKRIHVDRRVIAQNLKRGENSPPVKVQTSKGSIACYGVTIFGGSRVIYSPEKPLSCGARLWIETRAETMQQYSPRPGAAPSAGGRPKKKNPRHR